MDDLSALLMSSEVSVLARCPKKRSRPLGTDKHVAVVHYWRWYKMHAAPHQMSSNVTHGRRFCLHSLPIYYSSRATFLM